MKNKLNLQNPIIILSIIVLGILSLLNSGSIVREMNYRFPIITTAFNFFFTPKDFWDPVSRKLALAPQRTKYEFKVKHKYSGNYGLAFSFVSVRNMKELDFDSCTKIRSKLKLSVRGSKTTNYCSNSRCGYHEIYSKGILSELSFHCCEYDYPRDVQTKESIISVEIDKSDLEELIKLYGKVYIEIEKGSDE